MDVIMHAVNRIKLKSEPTLVCSVQANSPDLKIKNLDDAIMYAVKNNLNEVISVDFKQIQNSAFRIMKLDTVFQRSLSTNVGFYRCKATDVHTLQDIKKIKV